MTAIRVTSMNLGFMIALQTRFQGTRFNRVYPRRWWWIRKRYEILIRIDSAGSYKDYRIRSEILTVGSKCRCYKFHMEIVDEESERSYS